jgi:hypothetical protein
MAIGMPSAVSTHKKKRVLNELREKEISGNLIDEGEATR